MVVVRLVLPALLLLLALAVACGTEAEITTSTSRPTSTPLPTATPVASSPTPPLETLYDLSNLRVLRPNDFEDPVVNPNVDLSWKKDDYPTIWGCHVGTTVSHGGNRWIAFSKDGDFERTNPVVLIRGFKQLPIRGVCYEMIVKYNGTRVFTFSTEVLQQRRWDRATVMFRLIEDTAYRKIPKSVVRAYKPQPTAVPTPTVASTTTPIFTKIVTPIPTLTTVPTATLVPTNTPSPTPTNAPTPMPTSTPVPTATATPKPATATLPTADCNPSPCHTDTAPVVAYVDWLEPPKVTASGRFTFKARVHDGHDIKIATPAPNGGRLNVHFSRGGDIYGSVLPVDNTSGWKWSDKPTAWEADVYTYEGNVLAVVAQINPNAATHPGLRMCLWSGGATRGETYILGCIEVEQP